MADMTSNTGAAATSSALALVPPTTTDEAVPRTTKGEKPVHPGLGMPRLDPTDRAQIRNVFETFWYNKLWDVLSQRFRRKEMWVRGPLISHTLVFLSHWVLSVPLEEAMTINEQAKDEMVESLRYWARQLTPGFNEIDNVWYSAARYHVDYVMAERVMHETRVKHARRVSVRTKHCRVRHKAIMTWLVNNRAKNGSANGALIPASRTIAHVAKHGRSQGAPGDCDQFTPFGDMQSLPALEPETEPQATPDPSGQTQRVGLMPTSTGLGMPSSIHTAMPLSMPQQTTMATQTAMPPIAQVLHLPGSSSDQSLDLDGQGTDWPHFMANTYIHVQYAEPMDLDSQQVPSQNVTRAATATDGELVDSGNSPWPLAFDPTWTQDMLGMGPDNEANHGQTQGSQQLGGLGHDFDFTTPASPDQVVPEWDINDWVNAPDD